MIKTYKVSRATGNVFPTPDRQSSWVLNYSFQNKKSLDNLFYRFVGRSLNLFIAYDDTQFVETMNYMFNRCQNLYEAPQMNTENVYMTQGMFQDCYNLKIVPNYNTKKVNNMGNMFKNCRALKEIPALDCGKSTVLGGMLENCLSVEKIGLFNINANLDISYCTKLQQPELHKLIDNLLPQNNERKNLKLGATLLERVSAEYKNKADIKGWDLI